MKPAKHTYKTWLKRRAKKKSIVLICILNKTTLVNNSFASSYYSHTTWKTENIKSTIFFIIFLLQYTKTIHRSLIAKKQEKKNYKQIIEQRIWEYIFRLAGVILFYVARIWKIPLFYAKIKTSIWLQNIVLENLTEKTNKQEKNTSNLYFSQNKLILTKTTTTKEHSTSNNT